MRLHHGLAVLMMAGFQACTQQSSYEPAPRVAANAGNGGAAESGGWWETNENGSEEGQEFFDGTIVAAFRSTSNGCLDCHDAPRNVLGNPDASDEGIYDYDKMFRLLKDGEFSNDNGFINPMLGEAPHPGDPICEDESDDLCALAVQWFDTEFAGAGSRYGEIDKVDITFTRISVIGKAKDIDNPDNALTVKAYIDGQMVGEGVADKFENGFNFVLDGMSRDSTADVEVSLFAVVNGEEQELGGSPYKFTAYVPAGAANFPELGPLGLSAGCGCHTAGEHGYESFWPDLILPSTGSAAAEGAKAGPNNNYLISLGLPPGHMMAHRLT